MILIASYFAHRQNSKKEARDATEANGSDRLSLIEKIKQITLAPDQFFKRISGNRISLWQPFVWLTIGGVILAFALVSSTGIGPAGSGALVLIIIFLLLLLIPL